jgi:hypothetical protein
MRWLAPAGILSGEADDQLLHLPGKRWPARLAMRVGPGTPDKRWCQRSSVLGFTNKQDQRGLGSTHG